MMNARLLRLECLNGTLAENAHMREYAKADKTVCPVRYMRIWMKHPQVECLLTSGAGKLLAEMIAGEVKERYASMQLKEVDWKKKRPCEMLGLDRQELRRAVREKWTAKELQWYKIGKSEGEKDLQKLQALLEGYRGEQLQEMKEYGPVLKTVRYLRKQEKMSEKKPVRRVLIGWSTLRDTWEMAKLQGLDLHDPAVQWPKDMIEYHDRLVENQKFRENKELVKRFAQLTDRFAPAAASWGGICIRIAASEKELKQEGEALKHCVGTYGESHANGRCIFFVRRAEQPDVSWYTLQVDIRDGTQLQLHGYRNDQNEPIPQAVRDFCEEWLEKVLRPLISKKKAKGEIKNGTDDGITKKAG